MSFAMPLGLLCSGIFAERIGVEKWFLLCGIGIIAVAVWFSYCQFYEMLIVNPKTVLLVKATIEKKTHLLK